MKVRLPRGSTHGSLCAHMSQELFRDEVGGAYTPPEPVETVSFKPVPEDDERLILRYPPKHPETR